MAAQIGSLRVSLGLDSAEFERGMKKAQSSLAAAGAKMQQVGAIMSAAFTAPLLLFASKAVPAFQEQAKAMAQVNAVLKSMGPVAGRTAAQLDAMADALEGASTFTGEDILTKVSANLLTFGKIQGDVFDRAQQAAIDLSARLGSDLQSSAIMVGKALQDPIKGLTALSRVGVSFTAEQKAMIEQMVKVGDVAGAQSLILAELERQYGGQAQAAQDATGGVDELKDSWGKFEETVGEIIAMVLPALTNALRGVVDWLNTLDPAVMQVGVQIAAALAIAGPFAIALGTVTAAVGLLAPAVTGLGLALAALTGPAGAIALVTAGLLALGVVAHNTWSSINNALQAGAGGPLSDYINQLGDVTKAIADLQNNPEAGGGFLIVDGVMEEIASTDRLNQLLEQQRNLRQTIAAISQGNTKAPSEPIIPPLVIPPVIVPELEEIETGLGGVKAAAAAVQPAVDAMGETFQTVGDQIAEIFDGISNSMASMATGIVKSFFKGEDAGKSFFDTIISGLDGIATKALDSAFGGIFDVIFGAFGSAFGGLAPGGAGFLGGGASSWGGLATGGRTMSAGLVEVGERGKELVQLPKGANVIRHNDIGDFAGGGKTHVTFGMSADQNGNILPFVQSIVSDGIETYRNHGLQQDIQLSVGDPLARGNL
ncbi:phage tail length tape measure family protein [Devosia sp. SL43]|uniref:phage tail length tape measure family protein n=1 Tax=Devosia sp. SL43 TaxID=2806348 RepID=UPI001F30955F|nr:phage tail length tape measure family protein [Devosia sp. SL43]UJW87953.1 phage tail length tape measure family protein [Devosia sp. SL43]